MIEKKAEDKNPPEIRESIYTQLSEGYARLPKNPPKDSPPPPLLKNPPKDSPPPPLLKNPPKDSPPPSKKE